jgi:tetratricopeptide (TPR) repeat protein
MEAVVLRLTCFLSVGLHSKRRCESGNDYSRATILEVSSWRTLSCKILTVLVASIYSNLGNLELATGNAEEASEYFDQSVKLWKEGGEATAFNLALTYLNIARLQKLRGQLDAAMETTMLSESLFKRTMGQDKGFMAK